MMIGLFTFTLHLPRYVHPIVEMIEKGKKTLIDICMSILHTKPKPISSQKLDD